MPRTTKSEAGGKRFPLNMRTTESVRDKLAKAAVDSGRSLAQEVEVRLERSFNDELALGGPEMRMLSMSLISSFYLRGTEAARNNGHPEWTVKEWMANSYCYSAAFVAAIETLMKNHPDSKSDAFRLMINDYFSNHDIRQPIATRRADDGGP
jgi:hypothetical protein